jgi:hypothetical protein
MVKRLGYGLWLVEKNLTRSRRQDHLHAFLFGPSRRNQYSSGSSKVVTERSDSVMIQSFTPSRRL